MRLTGLHETQSIDRFNYGARRPRRVDPHPARFINNGYRGYLEDRRPNSLGDPYRVAGRILQTIQTVPTDVPTAVPEEIGGLAMFKVEAVVIRERVETVIDAVEDATGHVGVTVIEAIGHGRERGVTHEYRGRVFESRFLPKALLVFVVADEIVDDVVAARSSTPRAAATSRATASAGPHPSTTSCTTAPARALEEVDVNV